jgi:hypothetical protein
MRFYFPGAEERNKQTADLSFNPTVFGMRRLGLKPRTLNSLEQSAEAYRPEHRPDSHLAQVSSRKGAREHVLHCDVSSKGLAVPTV